MRVVVPKEVAAGERRVALVPEAVSKLVKGDVAVRIESGAGVAAGFEDSAYVAAGAEIVGSPAALYTAADVILKVQRPTLAEVASYPSGSTLVSFLSPQTEPELVHALAERRVTSFAMELVPRITRAQKMDALSSQATVAGYKAVLLAASLSPKFFPMLTTAAGTVAPARVLVIGAGVAGLMAIATARRLGAIVEGFDIRPAAKEQVESLGAKFVGRTFDDAETAGGYAKEVTEEQKKEQHELLVKHVSAADVVITTAQVPGRRAPLLITNAMVEAMRPGSVIMDLASESGGNTEGCVAGQEVLVKGVTIASPTNLPATLPLHASQMYTRNIVELFKHIAGEDGVRIDLEDEITAGCCVTHAGEIVHPAVQASASAAA